MFMPPAARLTSALISVAKRWSSSDKTNWVHSGGLTLAYIWSSAIERPYRLRGVWLSATSRGTGVPRVWVRWTPAAIAAPASGPTTYSHRSDHEPWPKRTPTNVAHTPTAGLNAAPDIGPATKAPAAIVNPIAIP